MMRSLYSAVSGLKTHQTRMDVIGNNIANVNTESFKSTSVTFQEIMYQTISSASGGNAATGIGGINAKQIGLGVTTGATNVSITTAGAAETTGNPFDLRLSDSESTNFFVVSDGTNTFFTRSGSYYVDGNGFLCMTSTGYTLMGWQVDPTTGDIRKDTVSPLQIMSASNQTSAPEATTLGVVAGVLDKNDSNVTSEDGYVMTLGFYDDLGYSYTAKFNTKSTAVPGKYTIELSAVIDSEGRDVLDGTGVTVDDLFGGTVYVTDENGNIVDADGNVLTEQADGTWTYEVVTLVTATPDGTDADGNTIDANGNILTEQADGTWAYEEVTNVESTPLTTGGFELIYDTNDGTFISVGGEDTVTLTMSKILSNTVSEDGTVSNFKDIVIDFTSSLNLNNGGTSTLAAEKGVDGEGTGKKLGALTGLSVDTSGKVWGSYDNGNTVLLCQIAVAQFSNASGLEKVGNNCYQTTLNSGDFDGIGIEVSADGSSISTGELEMSNVDLSAQFTDMIITQRGFQANSRVITTSDTLLEELINLKR